LNEPPALDAELPTPVQRWTASDYAKNGRFVQELAGPIFHMLEAKPGERILDLGCGDGALTAEIRALGERPFLHAMAGNTAAIRLYESLGFSLRRELTFVSVSRR
jgi:hypothetical protein